jgi:leucyl-tRNA synthetase
MRGQLSSMGAMWDWRREAISSDPAYYHWTEWFFSQLYKNDLAYRKKSPVDWCPNCNTTLAREQVWGDDRHCERCKTPVIKKDLEQWFFRTTKYAEELLDFSGIDWPDKVKTMQTNWIGRSEGATVVFHTEHGDPMEVFTTRPDTLWGATFMVLAPEHPLIDRVTTPEQETVVMAYKDQAILQTEIQRASVDKDKTGVFTGGYAVNPVNQKRIPIWIADYVMMTYGSGAIMGVPAHDERDFEFALQFGLEIIPVIDRIDALCKSWIKTGKLKSGFVARLQSEGFDIDEKDDGIGIIIPSDKFDVYAGIAQEYLQPGSWCEVVGAKWAFIFKEGITYWDSVETGQNILERCKVIDPDINSVRTLMELLWSRVYFRDALFHHEYGGMINSEDFSGTPGDQAVQVVTKWLEDRGDGEFAVNYRLRDWLISRQRYWGAPIPMVFCEKCGWNPVPDDELPVLLPDDVEWLPTGESPLKLHPTWKYTTCPDCKGTAERETDTMDTFMCSSWYHLRYLSPDYDEGLFDPKEYDYWMPVDTYTGGAEHATMHLIYTRFYHKAGRDMGIMKGDEPMTQLRNQGQILGPDNQRMSKSRGNVIDPDEQVRNYGADAVRTYLMFGYRWSEGGPWNTENIQGVVRWLHRTWSMFTKNKRSVTVKPKVLRSLRRKVHQTLKQVSHDFETFEFNTIISSLMELSNEMIKAQDQGAAGTAEWTEAQEIYLCMLAPVAPHIAEELWTEVLGKGYSVHNQDWPEVDEEATKEDEITLIVQVNGKLRDRIAVVADISEADAKTAALASDSAKRFIGDKAVRKVIYIPGRLVNIVV